MVYSLAFVRSVAGRDVRKVYLPTLTRRSPAR